MQRLFSLLFGLALVGAGLYGVRESLQFHCDGAVAEVTVVAL
jgi:hypothetical protein